ncbi:putative bifunctional diguanylate cyclase/phosphodiesterase [Rhodanobacter aciditrophus]|uniref:Bifunctional diguanylate cyclase/phosphodiesterase n=1 Tax=Rhodanobacter aciditrophus TaxID=1623218 RepID=A0ABW4AZN0_9GAMM
MKLRHRIAYQQARIILFSAFIIGGLSAIAQFYVDMTAVRSQQIASIQQSITLYQPNIQRAVYNLDTDLAKSLAKLMADDPLFHSATIYDDFGDLMAVGFDSATPPATTWVNAMSFRLLDIPKKYQQPLNIENNSATQALLVVTLDTNRVAQGLANRALTLSISGFIATILLSGVLFIVFYHFFSKPIQRTSQWVAQLDHPDADLTPPYVRHDELGDLVFNVQDIWHKKDDAAKQVQSLAYYDPLTKLANRRMLTEQLDRAIEEVKQAQKTGVVMYLDLDRFKTINDSLGHHIGDRLLIEIAKRLGTLVGPQAQCARFGGDEFVLLLPSLDSQEEAVSNAIALAQNIIETIGAPARIGRNTIHCSTSIGLTIFPQHADNSSNVLRRADTALYRVKDAGRNGYQFYDESMQKEAKARWEIEAGLHRAVALNQLQIWLQPQVNSQHKITGAEVLLRWQHPQKGLVPPMEFISVAEESGQINALEEWVLTATIELLNTWQKQGLPSSFKRLSINISPAHFMQADFVERMLQILKKRHPGAVQIEFEITESLLIHNFINASKTMNTLQEHGISFAIDDFGTGYSSLRYLTQLPLDILKIDRSFIQQMEHSESDAAIVDVIMTTANKLGLAVIAEGVETHAQEQLLAERDCQLYQGFYFSKPQFHEQFYQLLIGQDGHIEPPSSS